MRAYFFGNMYLSSIQQGIQAHHCATEMYNKYFPRPTFEGECCFHASPQTVQLADWGHDHKTDVLLSAGFSETIREIHDGFEDFDNPYPFAKFHEGHDALDGALTCAGIILPEEIYEVAKEVRSSYGSVGRHNVDHFNRMGEWSAEYDTRVHTFSKWQVWLINELNKYPLAR